MQDDVDAFDCAGARFEVADVGLDEFERGPATIAELAANILEIAPVPSRKIVEAPDVLTQFEKCLDEVRSDEACSAGHEPFPLAFAKSPAKVLVPGVVQPVRHLRLLSAGTRWASMQLICPLLPMLLSASAPCAAARPA